MTRYVNSFLLDLGRVEKFEIISVNETVTVKDLTFENKHTYWKSVTTGELYLPFDNPDVNLDSDYAIYKKEKNLLSTKEIVQIRKRYGLSLRSFAKILGIGYSTLSKIENGAVQSNEHDALLRLANNPYSFYNNLVLPKSESLSDKELDKLKELSYKYGTNMVKVDTFNYNTKINLKNKFAKEDSKWLLPKILKSQQFIQLS